ncbi:MAG: T9SS type A sorting domain-containing protein [Bacteroidales bacterium]
MKKLLIVVLTVMSQFTFGQNWQWAKQFSQSPNPNIESSATSELDIYDVKIASSGNVYVAGTYISNFILNGVTYNGYPSSASTKPDIFLAKFNSSGDVQWVKTIGSSEGDLPEAIVIDESENIYLAGRFKSTCDFGDGYSLTATTSTFFDGFILKYNSSGTVQWVKNIAYGTDNERVTGITLGTDGNLYIAGFAKSSSFTVGDGTTGDTYTNADANADLFLASYTSSGSKIWSKQIATNNNSNILRAIACNGDNDLYVGGALFGTVTIDGINYTSSGSGDIIYFKASSLDGSSEWVRKGGSTLDDQLNSIAIYEDYSYLIGYIQGTGTIDSTSTLQSSSFTTAGSNDIFLAKYNLEGRLLWKKTIGSTGTDVGYGLNILNNVLVATGYFANTLNFNLSTITSGGNTDAAFFVFDVESNAVLAKSASGAGEDRGQGVALDEDYNVYMGGFFKSASLTVGTNTFTNSSSPSTTYKDLFFAKYQNEYTATFTHKKNVTCNGGNDGELTVTPYFGTPPYTYAWEKDDVTIAPTDSAITNLDAGKYDVTVTDGNSNTVTLTYTVTQATALSIGNTLTNVSCYGLMDGAINITTSGGTNPYTYFWTTTDGCGQDIDAEDQSGLAKGTYTVEVSDKNGCTATKDITITEPTQISITGTVTNISGTGSNGAVDATVSGGSGTYSNYSWKLNNVEVETTEDITGLNTGGDYTLVVTDNTSCVDSSTFTVLDERVFHAWISAKTNINCKGDATGSATVSYAENTGSVTILWNTSEVDFTISGKIAATYSADLTDDMGTPLDAGDDEVIHISVTLTEPSAILDGSITGTPTTCYGGTNGTLDLTPSGGTHPYTYSWDTSPVKTTQDVNNLTAGTYHVTITDSKGCSTVIPGTVSQPDDITFGFSATEPTCYGSSNGSLSVSSLTGGTPSYSYLWSNTLTSTTISNIKAGNYWLKVTDSKGCYKTQTTTLTQPTQITISHLVNNPTCPESTDGSIGLTVTGGTGTKTYFWTGPDIVNATNKDQTGLGVGTYNVLVTDDNSCTKSYQVILTNENPSPTPGISSSEIDNAICIGDNIIFTATGGNTYEFFLNGGLIQGSSTDATYNTTSLSNGDEVYAIVTSSYGCSAITSTITTTVNTLPVVTLANQASVCEGSAAIALTGGSPALGTYSGTGVSGGDFDPVVAGVGTHSITYTYTDGNGCTNSASKDKIVNALPTVSLADQASVCEGSAAVALSGGLPALGTYSGTGVSGGNFDPVIAGVGTHSITYSYTDGNGCTNSASKDKVVNSLPVVTLADLASVCEGSAAVTLTGGSPALGTFSGTGVSGNTFDPTIAGVGTHSITYSYTDGNGCTNSASKDKVVNALPTVVANATQTVLCEGDPLTLTGGGATSYIWDQGVDDGVEFYPSTTQTYTVIGTDSNGCSNSDQIEITVNPVPVALVSTTDPVAYCQGDAVSTLFEASPSDASSYQWIRNGLNISGALLNSYTATQPGLYSVFVIKDGCWAISDDIEIIENPLPTVSLSDLSPICVDASPITLDGGLPSGGTYSGKGVTGTTFDPTAAGVGIQAITYTYTDGNTCTNSASKDIVVNALPDVTLADLAPICVDASPITLDGGLPAGGTYSGTGVTGTTFDPTTAGTGTQTITYTYTDGNSCTNYASKDIVVNALPDVTLADFAPVCVNSSPVTLTGGLPDGGTYSLNGVDITEFDPVSAGVGTHTITYTYTDGNSCVNSASKDIVVNALPDVTIADFAPICVNGSPVTLTGGLPEGGTYSLNGTDITEFDPTTDGTGTHTITYTYTDGNSCSNSADKDIVVNALPEVTLVDFAAVCVNGSPVTLAGGLPEGGTYSLNGTDITEFDPATAGAGTHTITYTYTDGNSCSNYASKDIVVNALPDVTLADFAPVCVNSSPVTLTGGLPDGGTYSLNGVDITEFDPVSAGVGTHTITYTYTDGNSCSNSANKDIVVSALPDVTIANFAPICVNGSPVTLTGGLPEGGTYSLNGTDITEFDPTTAGTGTHTITYTYTDGNSCSNSADKDIVVNALPGVTLADFSPVCVNGSPVTLTGGLPEGGTYSLNGTDITEFDPATAGAGIHTITYTYTDGNSCSNSADKDIVVNNLPTPTVTTTDPTVWCEGTSISINLSTETAENYQWIHNGVDISGENLQTYTATSTGNYSVRVTNSGCTAISTEINITSISPSVSIETKDPLTWCSNEEVNIVLQANPQGAQTYQWNKDGTDIDGATLFEYTTNEAGVYLVKATFGGGCSATSDNITLTENAAPEINLSSDTIRIDTQSSVTLNAGEGFTTYLWNDNSTQQTLVVDGAVTGVGIFSYWVTVTNDNSCSATDTAVVKVKLWDDISTNYGWITNLYPNPTTGEFKLHITGLKDGDYQLSIYNSTGKLVLMRNDKVSSNELIDPINLDKMPKGIYFIRFGKEEKWITRKIVLE